MLPHSIATSRRPSWKKSQKPPSFGYSGAWPHNSGTLVIASAPIMSTIIGRVASLVSESDQDQQATPDLEDTVEVGEELSGGNACLDEAAGPECIWPEELQDAFADEDQADIEADEDDRTGGPGGGQLDQ